MADQRAPDEITISYHQDGSQRTATGTVDALRGAGLLSGNTGPKPTINIDPCLLKQEQAKIADGFVGAVIVP